METIDVIIELLETGKNLNQLRSNSNTQSEGGDSTERIIKIINNIVGFDRTATIYAYFNGDINLKNAILRLVTDEPQVPMTSNLHKVATVSGIKMPNRRSLLSLQGKRGRKKVYDRRSCIDALHRATEHLGSNFTRAAYVEFAKGRNDYPSAFTITRYLHTDTKGWKKILTNAGLYHNVLKIAK